MITDYRFDDEGNVSIIPTNDNFDRVIIKESELAKMNKVKQSEENYDEDGNIVYKTNKGVIINVDDDFPIKQQFDVPYTNKKGVREGFGTKLTITDNAIADNIFKAIAANSRVEYGLAKYNYNGKLYNDMWTSRQPTTLYSNPIIDLARKYKVYEEIHSHTMKDADTKQGTLQKPSSDDMKAHKILKDYGETNPNLKDIKSKLSIPTASSSYLEYDENGVINKDQLIFDNPDDHKKALKEYKNEYNMSKTTPLPPMSYPTNDFEPLPNLSIMNNKKRRYLR